MTVQRWTTTILTVVVLCFGAFTSVAAQESSPTAIENGVPITLGARLCGEGDESGGCDPLDGLVITVTSPSGEFSTSCATAPYDGEGSTCEVIVPSNQQFVASVSPDDTPDGYTLLPRNTSFVSPATSAESLAVPPTFEYWDANVYAVTQTAAETLFPLSIGVRECGEPDELGSCNPADGYTVTVTSDDGASQGSCSSAHYDGQGSMCEVRVPTNTAVTVTLDAGQIPADRQLVTYNTHITTPDSVDGSVASIPRFELWDPAYLTDANTAGRDPYPDEQTGEVTTTDAPAGPAVNGQTTDANPGAADVQPTATTASTSDAPSTGSGQERSVGKSVLVGVGIVGVLGALFLLIQRLGRQTSEAARPTSRTRTTSRATQQTSRKRSTSDDTATTRETVRPANRKRRSTGSSSKKRRPRSE